MYGKSIDCVHDNLTMVFDDVLGKIAANDQDLVRMLINHPVLTDAIVVSFFKMSNMNAGVVMEHLDNVIHSNKSMDVSDYFDINVGVIRVPRGSGSMHLTNPTTDALRKRSVISIDNDDVLCQARSISMAWAHANVICMDEWHDLHDKSGSHLENMLQLGKVLKMYYNLPQKRCNGQRHLAGMPWTDPEI